ncbi:MAG: ankyrin repeat domain-containing protein [Bdellovibrionota bacterium]
MSQSFIFDDMFTLFLLHAKNNSHGEIEFAKINPQNGDITLSPWDVMVLDIEDLNDDNYVYLSAFTYASLMTVSHTKYYELAGGSAEMPQSPKLQTYLSQADRESARSEMKNFHHTLQVKPFNYFRFVKDGYPQSRIIRGLQDQWKNEYNINLYYQFNTETNIHDFWYAIFATTTHSTQFTDPKPLTGGLIKICESDKISIPHLKSWTSKVALRNAISGGNEKLAISMVKNGLDVEQADEKGVTEFMMASSRGMIDLVKEMIKQKVNVDAKTTEGVTALMVAANAGHLEVVNALIEAGANSAMTSNAGDTALDYAKMNGNGKVIWALGQASR